MLYSFPDSEITHPRTHECTQIPGRVAEREDSLPAPQPGRKALLPFPWEELVQGDARLALQPEKPAPLQAPSSRPRFQFHLFTARDWRRKSCHCWTKPGFHTFPVLAKTRTGGEAPRWARLLPRGQGRPLLGPRGGLMPTRDGNRSAPRPAHSKHSATVGPPRTPLLFFLTS